MCQIYYISYCSFGKLKQNFAIGMKNHVVNKRNVRLMNIKIR